MHDIGRQACGQRLANDARPVRASERGSGKLIDIAVVRKQESAKKGGEEEESTPDRPDPHGETKPRPTLDRDH